MAAEAANLKVVVRVRPLNVREAKASHHLPPFSQPNGEDAARSAQHQVAGSWLLNSCSLQQQGTANRSYTFDRVFSPDERTEALYRHLVHPILHSAMRGINGTIFAYGQTSSGKTHTMQGTEQDVGVIPLCVRDLFAFIEDDTEREYLVRASYIEIYNEVVRDLLEPRNANLKIHESHERGVYVAGLREDIVTSAEQLLKLMENGAAARRVGATNVNELSSRSHTIFQIMIESRARKDDEDADAESAGDASGNCAPGRMSSINLVDLAGSERAKSTGAVGERLKEGSHINKSLLALSSVIKKLSDGDASHIPYRDSKLTRILQPALGGNSMTGVICAMTPAPLHCEETHSTLQFASRAKRIANKPVVNEVIDDQTMMKRLKTEASTLRKQVQELSSGELPQQLQQLRDQHLSTEALVAHQQARIEKLTKLIIVSSKIQMPMHSTSKPASLSPNSKTHENDDADEEAADFGAMTLPLKPVKAKQLLLDPSKLQSNRRLSLTFRANGSVTTMDCLDITDPSPTIIQERLKFIESEHRELRTSASKQKQTLEETISRKAELEQLNAALTQRTEELSKELETATISESNLRTCFEEFKQNSEATLHDQISAAQNAVEKARETEEALTLAIAMGEKLSNEASKLRNLTEEQAEEIEQQIESERMLGERISEQTGIFADLTRLAEETATTLSTNPRTLEAANLTSDADQEAQVSSHTEDQPDGDDDGFDILEPLEQAIKRHECILSSLLAAAKKSVIQSEHDRSVLAEVQEELLKFKSASTASEAKRKEIAGAEAKLKIAERDLASRSTQLQRLEEKFEQQRTKMRSVQDEATKNRAAVVSAEKDAVRLRKRVEELERSQDRRDKVVQQKAQKDVAEPLRAAKAAQEAAETAHREAADRLAEAETEGLALKSALDDVQTCLAEAQSDLANARVELGDASKELDCVRFQLDESQSALNEAHKNVAHFREQTSELEEALCDANARMQQLEDDLVRERQARHNSIEQFEAATQELQIARADLANLVVEHMQQDEAQSGLQDELSSVRAEIDRKKTEAAMRDARMEELSKQLAAQDERIEAARADVVAANAESCDLRERMQEAKIAADSAASDYNSMLREVKREMETSLKAARAETQSAVSRAEKSEQQVVQLQEQIKQREEAGVATPQNSDALQKLAEENEELREEVAQFKIHKRRFARESQKAVREATDELQIKVQELIVSESEVDRLKNELAELRKVYEQQIESFQEKEQRLGKQAKDTIMELKQENARLRAGAEKENFA